MTEALPFGGLLDFLNGEIFGFLLHAGQVLFAELLLGFSIKRKDHFALRLAVCVPVYLALSVMFGLILQSVFPHSRYAAAFFLSVLIFPVCFDAQIWDELYCIAAATALQNLSYSVCAFLVTVLGGDPLKTSGTFIILQIAVYLGIHLVTFYLFLGQLKDIEGAGQEHLRMVVVSLVLILVVYWMQEDKQDSAFPYFLHWKIMFIDHDVLILYMLLGMYDRNRLRKENAVLESLRSAERNQYEYDKRTIEMLNIKSHDLKHQIAALRSLEGEEREKALDEIEEAVFHYNSIAKTGNKPVDTILSSKALVCEKYGISLTYMIDGEKLAFMKTLDVYSLFGNALDNAIQAERKVADEEKRFIDVKVFAKGRLLVLHMENYWDEPVTFRDGRPVSTKADSDNHGFGLISIRRIVSQYKGVMSVGKKNDLFCLDITIPIPNAAEA